MKKILEYLMIIEILKKDNNIDSNTIFNMKKRADVLKTEFIKKFK